MNSSFQQILSLLFPRRCPVCGEMIRAAAPQLCENCAAQWQKESALPCPLCQRKARECRCAPAALSGISNMVVYSAGFYEPGNTHAVTSRLVYALKHRADDGAAHVLARDLAGVILRGGLAEGEDIHTWTITYAPRSAAGLAKDGFDQSRRLAKLCARYTGARFAEIFRRDGGEMQKKLSEEARRINAAASIRLRHPGRTYSGKYILVDDIITTGATLAECAALLRQSGARSVVFAAALRTRPKRKKRPEQTKLWFAPSEI